MKVVDGPARLVRCGKFFEECRRHVANEDEYLVIKFRDGRTEIRRGPASITFHPVEHSAVEVNSAVRIADQELIVVYRKTGNAPFGSPAPAVKRELVRGPGIYMPLSVSDWVHQFSWTGAVTANASTNDVGKKRVDGLKFTKLRTSPGKMYYDVENVRTMDNALISVKFMIFFSLTDVETMLDNSTDPFGDLINAISADIIEWCSTKKFDEFLAATDTLNTLEPYPQLRGSATKVGMEVSKVVFRGYDAPIVLQRMHDKAIEQRTALALSQETEAEEQRLLDFKLTKETERAARQGQLETERLNLDLAMKQKTHEAELQRKREEMVVEIERLTQIKNLDKNANIVDYLIAKDGHLPPVVQCGTMMSGTANTGKFSAPSFFPFGQAS